MVNIKKLAIAPPANEPLYPELSDISGVGDGTRCQHQSTPMVQSYRLQEISRLRGHLEEERDKRSQLYKMYNRGVWSIDGLDTALLTASMEMGIGGVGLLSTIIAAPVVWGLEIAAPACGILGVAGKFVSQRLAVKAKKHDEIHILAEIE